MEISLISTKGQRFKLSYLLNELKNETTLNANINEKIIGSDEKSNFDDSDLAEIDFIGFHHTRFHRNNFGFGQKAEAFIEPHEVNNHPSVIAVRDVINTHEISYHTAPEEITFSFSLETEDGVSLPDGIQVLMHNTTVKKELLYGQSNQTIQVSFTENQSLPFTLIVLKKVNNTLTIDNRYKPVKFTGTTSNTISTTNKHLGEIMLIRNLIAYGTRSSNAIPVSLNTETSRYKAHDEIDEQSQSYVRWFKFVPPTSKTYSIRRTFHDFNNHDGTPSGAITIVLEYTNGNTQFLDFCINDRDEDVQSCDYYMESGKKYLLAVRSYDQDKPDFTLLVSD